MPPAVVIPDRGTVGVNESLYDVCSTFGKRSEDCLGFVLGHELAHVRLKHHESEALAKATEPADRTVHRSESFEAAADYTAGFLGHAAGLRTLDIGDRVLERVYGCPDCADGGAEWIAVEAEERSHRVTFERSDPPEGIAPLATMLDRYRNALVAQLD